MTPRRFYIDEDPPEALSEELRALGHDAVNTRELGHKGRRDPWQLAFAARERRIFVTCNHKHFAMLHEAWQLWARDWGATSQAIHAGVLVVPNANSVRVPAMVAMIQEIISTEPILENRMLHWRLASGWAEIRPDLSPSRS